MAKAFEWLSSRQYAGVQRALRSIWFGEPAPIKEAAQAMETDEGLLQEHLADFANLIVQALPVLPDSVKRASTWQEQRVVARLFDGLQGRIAELNRLHAEKTTLEAQIAYVNSQIEQYHQPMRVAQERLRVAKAREAALRAHVTKVEKEVSKLQLRLGTLVVTARAIETALSESSSQRGA